MLRPKEAYTVASQDEKRMQVTCVHCGMEAAVTPEFHQCRHCHGDLAALVTAEFKATYYFRKAQESAAHGAAFVALEQIQRGLQAQDRSDLHLLAAIMYADLGREEQLRMHIGAIPTDDVLRPEAESLLRRLARDQGVKSPGGDAEQTAKASGTPPTGLGPRLLASVLTMVIVLAVVGTVTQAPNNLRFTSWLPRSWSEVLGGTAGQVREILNRDPAATTEPMSAPRGAEELSAADTVLPVPAAATQDSPADILPTPSVAEPAPDLATAMWRQNVTQNVMGLIARETIDFTQILVGRGLTDLADSEIVGVVQGDHLVLIGSVDSLAAKQSVLAEVSKFEGLGSVDAYRLQVVLPKRSHVIQQGESLWGIAEKYLGDGALWVEIVALNPDLELGALKAGTTLVIPPAPQTASTVQ